MTNQKTTSSVSEKMTLAALNFHPEWTPQVREVLPDPEMFTTLMYDKLYRGFLSLYDAEGTADLVLAAERGGVPLAVALDVLLELPSDLWIIAKLDLDRLLIHARSIQSAWIHQQTILAAERQDGAQILIDKLSQLARTGTDKRFNAEELAMLLITENANPSERLPYPFQPWQFASSGGMRRDEMVVIAARPQTGKTAIMLQWAWELSGSGKKVLFASAEMSAKALIQRLASHLSHRNLMSPSSAEDHHLLSAMADQISRSGFFIHELSTTAQVEERLKNEGDELDVVFIDYLHQLEPRGRFQGEYERVTSVTRELDAMSMRYSMPLVVASQFNRQAERQQPTMADLRSSGQIEQAADVIISLWGKPEEQVNPRRAKVHFDILKNRNGTSLHNTDGHEYALWFDKPTFTFSDMETGR